MKKLTKQLHSFCITSIILSILFFTRCSSINAIDSEEIYEIKPQVTVNGDFEFPIAIGSSDLQGYCNYYLGNRILNTIDQIRYEKNGVFLVNRYKFNQSDYGTIGDVVSFLGRLAIQTNDNIILFEHENGFNEIDRIKIENTDMSLKINDIIEPKNHSMKIIKEFIIDNNIVCTYVGKLIGHETFKRIFPTLRTDDEIIRTFIDFGKQNVIIKRQIKSNLYELIMINSNTNLDSMYGDKNKINENNYRIKSLLKFNEDNAKMNSFAQGNIESDELFFTEVGIHENKTFAYFLKYENKNPTILKFDSLQLKYLKDPVQLEVLYAGDNFMVTYYDNEYQIINRDSLKPIAKFNNPPALNRDIIISELYHQKDNCDDELQFDSDLFICVNSSNAGGQISIFKFPTCNNPIIDQIETNNYSKIIESNNLTIAKYSYEYDCMNSTLSELVLEIINSSDKCISNAKITVTLKNYKSEIIYSRDIQLDLEVCPNEHVTYSIPEINNVRILSENWCHNGYIDIKVNKKFSLNKLKE